MMIYPGSVVAVCFGFLLVAESDVGTLVGNGGAVGVVGGILVSLYGLWVQNQQNQRIAENTEGVAAAKKEAEKAKAEAEEAKKHAKEVEDVAKRKADDLQALCEKQQAEIDRLRQGQHDMRGNQQVIQDTQAEMKADIARKSYTPDPEHPFPIVIVKPHVPPGSQP